MDLRQWLDAILSVIGAESLNDTEYATFNLELGMVFNQQVYDQLFAVIESRDLVSNTKERLLAFFVAKGITVTPAVSGRSNIFMGAPL